MGLAGLGTAKMSGTAMTWTSGPPWSGGRKAGRASTSPLGVEGNCLDWFKVLLLFVLSSRMFYQGATCNWWSVSFELIIVVGDMAWQTMLHSIVQTHWQPLSLNNGTIHVCSEQQCISLFAATRRCKIVEWLTIQLKLWFTPLPSYQPLVYLRYLCIPFPAVLHNPNGCNRSVPVDSPCSPEEVTKACSNMFKPDWQMIHPDRLVFNS